MWRAQVRLAGFVTESALFKTKRSAERWARQKESELQDLRTDAHDHARKKTMAQLIDRYETHVLPTRTESADYIRCQRCRFNYWRGRIGKMKVADITPPLLSLESDRLKEGDRGNATVNRYFSALSHIFTVAKQDWGWATVNPCADVRRLKEAEPKNSFAEINEVSRILTAAAMDKEASVMVPFIRIAMGAGARKSEIAHILTRNVYPKERRILLTKTKTGKARMIYVDAETMAMLVGLIDDDRLYLFAHKRTRKPYDNRRAWERIRARADMKHYVFHDNRHTFATYLSQSGTSPTDLIGLTGHKKMESVTRYIHHAPGHLTERAGAAQEMMFNPIQENTHAV